MIYALLLLISILALIFLAGCKKKKFNDLNGTVPPLLGYVGFPDDDHNLAFNSIKPNIVRLAAHSMDELKQIIDIARMYRSKGVLVVLMITDRYNFFNTPNLVVYAAKKLHATGVYFECHNEPEVELALPGEGYSNLISPAKYMSVYTLFREKLKAVNQEIQTMHAGVSGGSAGIEWLRKAVDLGISEITDMWNFHTYDDSLKEFEEHVTQLRKYDSNKPIFIGEFGIKNADTNTKIKAHKRFIDKFTLNKIWGATVFAWGNGQEFSMYDKPNYISIVKQYNRHPSTIL